MNVQPILTGTAAAYLRTPPPGRYLRHGDCNAAWTPFVAPRDRQLEHAVLQVRLYLRRVKVVAQRESAREVRLADFRVLHPQPRKGGDGRFRLNMEVAVVDIDRARQKFCV